MVNRCLYFNSQYVFAHARALCKEGEPLQGGSAIICRNMGLKYKFPGISGQSSITWYNPRKPGMVGRYVSSYSSQKRKMIYALIARC